MNWRRSVSICLLLLAGCASVNDDELAYFPNVGAYDASPQQERVDRSFSDILIITPLDQIRSRLTEIRVDGCDEDGECEWQDSEGVRYYLWADEPFAYFVVDKRVFAGEFEGRPISALGIGLARKRGEVLRAARRFAPDATFECHEWREDSHWETCQAFLDPGNVSIDFDRQGTLVEVHFTGYHYT
jgi:hypothetical protein